MATQEIINRLKEKIEQAEAIVVGGASGMSAASGFVFYYQDDDVFRSLAGSLAQKYNHHNLFDLFYDRRLSRGEYWALVLRTTRYVYECPTGGTYRDLAELLEGKTFYVATTNQDAQFFRVFPRERITRLQGDWRYWQCSRPCHDRIYDNDETSRRLIGEIRNDALPDDRIPRCPHCGRVAVPNLRKDDTFVDALYHEGYPRYRAFLERALESPGELLLLELGVGFNTPGIIRLPFEQFAERTCARLIRLNLTEAGIPEKLEGRGMGFAVDAAAVLREVWRPRYREGDSFPESR